jgi:hypothetical protein
VTFSISAASPVAGFSGAGWALGAVATVSPSRTASVSASLAMPEA